MTRNAAQPNNKKTMKQYAAVPDKRKIMNHSTAVKQYALNSNDCRMNFFGAGSIKSEW
jgi:hypothetical protein